MKIRFLFFLLLLATCGWASNRIYSPRVKSLTSIVNGDWLNRPVMTLNSSDKLVVGFDELSHDFHRLTYRLEHCEADWSTSEDIFESDWLNGFNNNPIDDYLHSINTTVLYTHYQFSIPNERCQLKLSGNYRITVFDEDADNERLLEVEFYVVEPLTSVGLEVSSNTDIDHNVSHQQVSFSLKYNDLHINQFEDELYTVVMQNWREQNARTNLRPTFVNNQGASWQHNRQLIFDAGNEFHKFEVLDVKHTTMGLDHIEWDGHYFQAYPFTSTVQRNYLTDVDADGAFVIRNSDNVECDYTCDYVWVNYSLQTPYQGDIQLWGHWTIDHNPDAYKMTYDDTTQTYYASVLQKQGYYSYQYLTSAGNIAPSEGNFFQTENRYQVLVYYKETGARTWQLVGYRALDFR